jgi:predicted nucleic acid-binding protein
MIYADSSFLMSLYFPESHSERAFNALQKEKYPLVLTSLHTLEVSNGFRAKVFRAEINEREYEDIKQIWEQDTLTERFVLKEPSWPLWKMEAERLSQVYTRKLGSRTYDILHVAAALLLGVQVFFTHDERQRNMAKSEGLKVNS